MARTNFQSVDEYLATLPEGTRAVLERVRGAIRKGLPDAEEGISYQIPAYRLHGKAELYFAGWKQHFSLYPASGPLIEAFADELSPYVISKGTIRFPLDEPVPVKLIEKLARFRALEADERNKAKQAARRKG